MLRSLGLSLMCLAMFSIAGGHWAVLQTVAWAQMLRDYSKDATVAEAVEKTFSGDAPCSLCKQIETARQKEEKAPPMLKIDKKSESFTSPVSVCLLPPPETNFIYPLINSLAGPLRLEGPPRPVPKAAFLSVA